MLFDLIQTIIDGLAVTLSAILKLLPQSPFNGLTAVMLDSDMLGYLAYLIPIQQIVVTLEMWCLAVGMYYLYMIPMRWAKSIE